MYIENIVPNLHSADGWKEVKSTFLTYFNPLGSTKEQQIKAWKEMVLKPEEEKITDFVYRFSQLAYELDYPDEQQISHFLLCIPKGLYLYLKGAQTVPDAVDNLRKGIALGGLDTFNSTHRTTEDDSKHSVPFTAMKEKSSQPVIEDTLRAVRAVKDSIQDSMYVNSKTIKTMMKLNELNMKQMDRLGDRLSNVVNVVEDIQRKQSSRRRNRERSDSRDRDHSRDNYKNRDRDRRESRDYTNYIWNNSRKDSRDRDDIKIGLI